MVVSDALACCVACGHADPLESISLGDRPLGFRLAPQPGKQPLRVQQDRHTDEHQIGHNRRRDNPRQPQDWTIVIVNIKFMTAARAEQIVWFRRCVAAARRHAIGLV
jgi:hypothetical protein